MICDLVWGGGVWIWEVVGELKCFWVLLASCYVWYRDEVRKSFVFDCRRSKMFNLGEAQNLEQMIKSGKKS